MSKWHAHAAHMAKNMNKAGGHFGGGWCPPLNQALYIFHITLLV